MADPNLTDIVNAVTKVFELCSSNETTEMPEHAHAVPRNVDPLTGTAGWSDTQARMVGTLRYPPAHKLPLIPAAPDDVIKLGMNWTYGGSVNGHGRYIKDAEGFVIVENVNATVLFDVSVKFAESGTPVGPEPVALLTATINVRVSQRIVGLLFTQFFGCRLFGNGSGDITQIS
jgi:hypothetical protein